jgi:hypothetical protein
MRALRLFFFIACAAAAWPSAAAPASRAPGAPLTSDAASLSPAVLVAGSWFINLGPGSRDALRFFAIGPEDAGRLYLRRFATPSFYLDTLAGRELKILLWPEPKRRSLDFAPDGSSFTRETSPIKLEYRRSAGSTPRGASTPYEGDWDVGDPAMTLSIRPCEKRAWAVAMYFPGDPFSAIPMGYYPLYSVGEGVYRSSSVFADSGVELEYDPGSDALVIRPLFKERALAAELYEPVRAWRGE